LKKWRWPGWQFLRLTSNDLHTAFAMGLVILIKALKKGKIELVKQSKCAGAQVRVSTMAYATIFPQWDYSARS